MLFDFMDIGHLKQQTIDIINNIRKCRDPLNLCVLQDILDEKQKKLRALVELKKKQDIVDNALDELVSQKDNENYEQSEAYQRILEENENDRKIREKRNKFDKQWNRVADPRYVKTVEQDFSNNKLMERMNGELDFRLNGIDKDTIIKPYSQTDEDNGDYVSVKKFKHYGIPGDNFSSKRFLGVRKNIL
jgi:hypothetical protein